LAPAKSRAKRYPGELAGAGRIVSRDRAVVAGTATAARLSGAWIRDCTSMFCNPTEAL
jgi:hypothetical protein